MAEITHDGTPPQDPKFINFLFTLKKYDCHFVVGNKQLIEPEKIGVVTLMLMAHSEVLQSEMVLREIEDKKCVTVNDMYPDTFRNLLRYVYGYDNTADLSFEEADNLLYAAEKYVIGTLKARLANRLIKLLNPDNICSLLNNPACYRQLELDSAITQILQNETDKVFGSPQFIDLSPDALIKVFEQDTMNIEEIEVWRAAIKWAKHRTNSDNGQDLRKALEGPAKHIQVCTIDDVSFIDEVCPAGILTDKEIIMVHASKIKNFKQSDPIKFSNEVKCRKNSSIPNELKFSSGIEYKMTTGAYGAIFIDTKTNPIQLLPFNLKWPWQCFLPGCIASLADRYQCKIIITQMFTTNPPLIFEVCKRMRDGDYCEVPLTIDGDYFKVPLTIDGKNIVLQPNSRYLVEIKFEEFEQSYYNGSDNIFTNEHISVRSPFKNNFDSPYSDPSCLLYHPLPVNSSKRQITFVLTDDK